ncbi:uncharacterized protein [Chiloscyllium punctatum]
MLLLLLYQLLLGTLGGHWAAAYSHPTHCTSDACYTAHMVAKPFWRALDSCKANGGNLATVKDEGEARHIHRLLESSLAGSPGARRRLWLGLQLPRRHCYQQHKPLRGFLWTSGGEESTYSNWAREPLSTCTAHRCVYLAASSSPSPGASGIRFAWADGVCSDHRVDGYLCKFSFRGMCRPVELAGPGSVTYTTPFDAKSATLALVPFGSLAAVSCQGSRSDSYTLCQETSPGSYGWSPAEPGLCAPLSACEAGNGGCAQICLDGLGGSATCSCRDGYALADDLRSCQPLDPCLGHPCEQLCVPRPGGFQCACDAGYALAGDGRSCPDVDECSSWPCAHRCQNTPGSYRCHCQPGYEANGHACVDMDECAGQPCQGPCANIQGSFRCFCWPGYVLSADGLSCTLRDVVSTPQDVVSTPQDVVSTQTAPATDWNVDVETGASWGATHDTMPTALGIHLGTTADIQPGEGTTRSSAITTFSTGSQPPVISPTGRELHGTNSALDPVRNEADRGWLLACVLGSLFAGLLLLCIVAVILCHRHRAAKGKADNGRHFSSWIQAPGPPPFRADDKVTSANSSINNYIEMETDQNTLAAGQSVGRSGFWSSTEAERVETMLLLLCLCLSAGLHGGLVHGVLSPQPAVQEPTPSVCVATVCYSLQRQRRKFNMARKLCKNGQGDAMTVGSTVAAEAIAVLLGSGGEVGGERPRWTGGGTESPAAGGGERPRWTGGGTESPAAGGGERPRWTGGGVKENFWIGLQLHHKACPSNESLLRGYRWVDGEAAANYSQWGAATEECGPRCVTVSAGGTWEERPCNQKADGVLCEYRYPGSCGRLRAGGNATVVYRTPFGADGRHLSELPAGTRAQVAPWGLEFTCRPGQAGEARGAWRGPQASAPWACQVENGGCQHTCHGDSGPGGGPWCGCPAGYTLGEDNTSCQPFDPCREARCEHRCIVQSGTPYCLCWDGYTLGEDSKSCTDVDECQHRPCEQRCVNTPGNFSCECFPGYRLGRDNKCEDVNECETITPCAQRCANTPGSYKCSCYPGYHQDPQDSRECVFYCEEKTNPCAARCIGSDCYCPVGYIYNDRLNLCDDINECDSDACDMTCTNTPGSFKCDCKEGLVLQEDGTTCDVEGSGSGSTLIPTTSSPRVIQPGQAGVSLVVVLASIFAIAVLTLVFAGLAHHLLAKRGKWKTSAAYKPTNVDMDLCQVTSLDEQKQQLQSTETSGVAT